MIKRKVGRPNTTARYTADVIKLYNDGYTYRGIMQIVPISIRSIFKIIKANSDKLSRGQYKGGRNRSKVR